MSTIEILKSKLKSRKPIEEINALLADTMKQTGENIYGVDFSTALSVFQIKIVLSTRHDKKG